MKNTPLIPGIARIRVGKIHAEITRIQNGMLGIREYTHMRRFTFNDVPFTGKSISLLTWTQIRNFENPTNILHVLWALWYAIAVCQDDAKRALLLQVTDRIAATCPEHIQGRGYQITPDRIRSDHEKNKSEYLNPTGITFWFRLIHFVPYFDYGSQVVIKTTGVLSGLEPDLLSVGSALKILKTELIARSPYPNGVWGSMECRGADIKTTIHYGSLKLLPVCSESCGGADFVLLSGGRTIWIPYPKPGITTYAAAV